MSINFFSIIKENSVDKKLFLLDRKFVEVFSVIIYQVFE